MSDQTTAGGFTPGQRVRLQSAIRYEAKNVEAIFVMAVGDDAMVYWPATSYQQSPEPFMTPLANLVAPEPPKAVPGQRYRWKGQAVVIGVGLLNGEIAVGLGDGGLAWKPFDSAWWEPVE